MPLYDSVLRPLLFRSDPESVHDFALRLISSGLIHGASFRDPRLLQTLLGTEFVNPIGLAAGFDKNAVALDQWHRFGFGFAECGTVTRLPQEGNPKPRLFRLAEDRALINRLGFNNLGADATAERIRKSNPRIPIGINIGKSRSVDLDEAPADYRASYDRLHGLGQYVAINISSPNTPGLRTLHERERLEEILDGLDAESSPTPLLIKVSPDLDSLALDEVIEVAVAHRVAGFIATNTTIGRDGLTVPTPESGGLSGRPIRMKSNQILAHLSRSIPPQMVLIGVGGIETAEDVYEKIGFGAHLTQLYTGWVYGGPALVPKLLRGLLNLLERDGYAHISDARGRLL